MNYAICQIAYFVTDIRAAALKAVETYGAGPFFVVPNIELKWGIHRGEECPFVHSSAYGQWGPIMMELVQQESEGASPFRDIYPPGKQGLHHVATMVDDQQQAYDHFEQQGLEVATRAMTLTGTEFVFVDAIEERGHFIELYERSEALEGFYQMVATAAEGWRGSDPLRSI